MAAVESTVRTESKRRYLERRLASLKTERTPFEAHWMDLAANFQPRRGRFSLDQNNRVDRRNSNIVDTAPLKAVSTQSAGMQSGMTNPARPWFRLTTPDPGLAEIGAVKQWLNVVEKRISAIFARSNLYTSLPGLYAEMGTFATAAMLMLPDDDMLLRFLPFTVGQYWLAQDYRGRVDTLYRAMRMSVRQVVQEFGLDNVSDRVRGDYRRGNLENWVDVIHAIEPNTDRQYGRSDAAGMPFRSCYFELGARNEDRLLAERGFRTNPILAPRWDLIAGDTYGTSCPGMDALGCAKALQVQTRRKGQAIDKWVDPPLQAPASLKISGGVDGMPGSITYYDGTHQGKGISSIYDWKPDIQYLLQDHEELRRQIMAAYFADLFLMVNTMDPTDRTAREIAELHEEKMLALGPVLERMNTDVLDPLIDGAFARLVEQSEPIWAGKLAGNPLLPEPPEELAGVDLRVEYISVLAQAQKLVGVSSLQQFIGFGMSMAQAMPEALDKIDAEQAMDEMADMLGVSPRVVRTDEAVAEIRAGREQQKQAMQAQAMAAGAAGIAKDLGSVPADGNNLLAKVAERVSGA